MIFYVATFHHSISVFLASHVNKKILEDMLKNQHFRWLLKWVQTRKLKLKAFLDSVNATSRLINVRDVFRANIIRNQLT